MSVHVHLTDEMIEKIIIEEGVTRPEKDGQCHLCHHRFKKEQLLEYFKVDFDEKIMYELGTGRYGVVLCHRCYNIIDAFMHECGSF